MTLMMDKDSAILHGAFLLANKLCLPSSLSSVHKADWIRVGLPVMEAVREVCRQDEIGGPPNTTAICWKKKIICVVWLKLLCREAGEDIDTAWRENPFFPLQNSLPEVSHVVLLELVKSMEAADIFARFLLCLSRSHICTELERLMRHVRSSPTAEDDVQLFLDVWWELWKGSNDQKTGEDCIEAMFANQLGRLSCKSSSLSPQAAKRLKLDTSDEQASSPPTGLLHILLHALKDIKDYISSTDLCLKALSISLDSLYTTFLIDQEVTLPTEEKMHILSKVISLRKNPHEKLSPELIQDAQRDLRASHTPSQFQPSKMKLDEALKIITELVQFWLNSGLLEMYNSSKSSYAAFKLQQSLQRVLTGLDEAQMTEIMAGIPIQENVKNILRGLLESLAFPAIQSSSEVEVEITTIIISHHLEDYQNFAMLFASEKSWAASNECWLDCLEKNQATFQQHDTLLNLASTLISKIQRDSSNVNQCRKLMKVIADIFSALPLEDKNKSLAAMLKLSSRGFFGCPVPSSVTDGFEQELNMAFNCIIQGRGGISASQGSLDTATSLVARMAFQNPEAALKSCCHLAVSNKGLFSLMAKILQQLPGLRGQRGRKEEAQSNDKERKEAEENTNQGNNEMRASSLICRCLQEMLKTKLLLASEKEQFLKFLGLLMMPVVTIEGEELRQSFLRPQEVINIFVLPNLFTKGHSSFDSELSVQLLHATLCVDVQDPVSSPHWVLDCSPFPLLYVLAQLHNEALRCWEQPVEGTVHHWSMDTKELLVSVLTTLGQVVGAEVAAAPSSWSRALFWLYNKMEELDWSVRFYLKPVWGEHFKNEVPSSLLTVCELPEQEWSGLDLPQYGHGTGLLAWMECCSISDSLRSIMLSHLSLDQHCADHVSMFSKGLLVALTQILPWCSVSQWSRLLGALRELITSGRLYVPFSLEYVDYLPLLDLRKFSCELRLSVLLLRVLQLLCGSSCSHWLSADGWAHVGRLYAHTVREMLTSVRAKLPLPSSGALTASVSTPPRTPPSKDSSHSCISVKVSKMSRDSLKELSLMKPAEEEETVPSQEVLFVLSQFFCHVQHVQVMMPGGQCEPLFLSSLEILSHYEAIMVAFPDTRIVLESDNTRHFFSTITDNLENEQMKAVLQQKIAQLVTSAA
ncbi:gem-associated protein 4 [Mastacembelus armatus]|uniref:Gem (nuclear organelle) associated protein 4 n=1 Tax=Mastacembelus armatus TaxID=205130 RepID=A0A3Q3L2M9_9TELE|nr:gem-associated protein 4 [Mastacembelus armatus]